VVKVGQIVQVHVLSSDAATKRIALSMKTPFLILTVCREHLITSAASTAEHQDSDQLGQDPLSGHPFLLSNRAEALESAGMGWERILLREPLK
jgi:transcriptional accessory protein Tex/SPT6